MLHLVRTDDVREEVADTVRWGIRRGKDFNTIRKEGENDYTKCN